MVMEQIEVAVAERIKGGPVSTDAGRGLLRELRGQDRAPPVVAGTRFALRTRAGGEFSPGIG